MGTKVKIVIGVVVVVVLAVVAVALLTGDDDGDKSKSAGDTTTKSADKSGKKSSSSSDSGASNEPALKTVAVKKSQGKNAAVNVGGIMHKPGAVYLRVSSAPKQKVTVNWTLACGVGATAQGDYDATPPDTRQLELPKKNPKTCVASASSQIDGNGRLKLAVMRDR
jgi:hypothetical protein